MDSDTNRLLVPYDETMHQLGDIGRTTLYELFDRGELTRVNIGRRGFVTAKSIAAYVDRLAGAPRESCPNDVERPTNRPDESDLENVSL